MVLILVERVGMKHSMISYKTIKNSIDQELKDAFIFIEMEITGSR